MITKYDLAKEYADSHTLYDDYEDLSVHIEAAYLEGYNKCLNMIEEHRPYKEWIKEQLSG